jgi:hypothetical protein
MEFTLRRFLKIHPQLGYAKCLVRAGLVTSCSPFMWALGQRSEEHELSKGNSDDIGNSCKFCKYYWAVNAVGRQIFRLRELLNYERAFFGKGIFNRGACWRR